MKKRKKNSRTIRNKADDKYAKKVVIQFAACVIIFIMVFANSKLSNNYSKVVNNQIKHYLCVSVDFNKVISTAAMYFESFIKNEKSVPVNATEELEAYDGN